MTIRLRSGFEALVLQTRGYFTEHGIDASVVVGFRERPKQSNQGPGRANRVCFLPGEASGAGGQLDVAIDTGIREILRPGAQPTDPPTVVGKVRSIATWTRKFSVSVWAYDSTAPRDELAQAVAAEQLLELTLRALTDGTANVETGAVSWVLPGENTLGAEVLVGLTLIAPLYDEPLDVVAPGFDLNRT